MHARLSILTAIVLFLGVAIPCVAQGPLPNYAAAIPAHIYSNNEPIMVTISGKGFRAGQILSLSGTIGGYQFPMTVVNQYKATALIYGVPIGYYRLYLLNKAGQVGPGEQYMEVCTPLSIQAIPQSPTPFQEDAAGSYQLKVTGGCVH